jgi:hypothetical protein
LVAHGAQAISPDIAANAVARFSPAIDTVGASCFGQRSVQLWCVWQAWHSASPATAASRSRRAPSRGSLTSVRD